YFHRRSYLSIRNEDGKPSSSSFEKKPNSGIDNTTSLRDRMIVWVSVAEPSTVSERPLNLIGYL
ncbi:MAG: hypothetical protein WCR24_05260, partial [Candidatus Methanomethylophilaceae archaeon]